VVLRRVLECLYSALLNPGSNRKGKGGGKYKGHNASCRGFLDLAGLVRMRPLEPLDHFVIRNRHAALRVGDLAIDLISRTASRRGKEILLRPKEFQLLEYLVRNKDCIVSRGMLLQHVWDLHFDPSTNIIDLYVGRLRRKVDDQQAYPLIHTIRGVGYCLRAPG
jgi:DNA-binding response OmpR family regulator